MCGKGKVCSFNDEELNQINKLLTDCGFPLLSSDLVRIHTKAIINGKSYSARINKRAKKQNSFTVMISNDPMYYGLIERFLCVEGHCLAAITELNVHKGISHDISSDVITPESQCLLFEDYFTYEEKVVKYDFANRIMEKCVNLSNSHHKLFTKLVNSLEKE